MQGVRPAGQDSEQPADNEQPAPPFWRAETAASGEATGPAMPPYRFSPFLVVKHSCWRGSYSRILGVRHATFFTADPGSGMITNEWPLDAVVRVEETPGPIFWLLLRRRLPCGVAIPERLCFGLHDALGRQYLLQLMHAAVQRATSTIARVATTAALPTAFEPTPAPAESVAASDPEPLDSYSAASSSPLFVRAADRDHDLDDFAILEGPDGCERLSAKATSMMAPDEQHSATDEDDDDDWLGEAVTQAAPIHRAASWHRMWPLTV